MASRDPIKEYPLGYPRLAAQMNLLPETAIFRRFGFLNAQNLLYLQAELTTLEDHLRRYQRDDSLNTTGNKSQYGLSWYWLEQSAEDGDTLQLDLVLKIRKTINEYNEALIQQSVILKFSRPDQLDLEYVQSFLEPKSKNTGTLIIPGPDGETWGSVADRKSYSPDLVTLCPRQTEDPFSSWISKAALVNIFRCGCHRFMKKSQKRGTIGTMDTTILKITQWITSILASLFPIASVLVLYRVQSMPARLGIIAGFNILLSISLIGFAGAKRSEVFAVTAAFAAVQVVFVGTDKTTTVAV